MRGEPGRAAAGAAAATVWAIRDRYLDAVPLPDAAVAELFEDIGAQLAAIHAAEVMAVDALADAMR